MYNKINKPALKNKNQSRRHFLKTAGLGLVLSMGYLWNKLVKTENQLSTQKKISLPFNPNKNISFQDDFIIINSNHQTKVFSSHCTHLGCKINKTDGDSLLCPCHGSAFDTDGNAIKGPAINPLKPLSFSIDKATNQITVEV